MEIYKNLDINNLENEVWKDILDYEGDYQVSNIGRVKSFIKYNGTNERILKQHKRGYYFCVDLYKNKKPKRKLVHRLVFEAHGSCKLKDDECVHHINGDKEDNIFKNLIMMPESEHLSFHKNGENNPLFGKHHSEKTKNKMSEVKKGKNNPMFEIKGENHPRHKLTEEQVIQIKLLLKEGKLNQQEIADMFGVDNTTISKIKTGKIWDYIKI